MILEKETALFQKDKISDEIIAAKQTADRYITAIDQSGIKVHAENSPNINYSKINGEGLEVFKGTTVNNSTSVAKFGDIARVGAEDSQRTILSPSGYYIYDSDGTPQFSVSAQGATKTGTISVDIPQGQETEIAIASGSSFTYKLRTRNNATSGTATATVGTVANGNCGMLKIISTDAISTVFLYTHTEAGYCTIMFPTTYYIPLIETMGDCNIGGLVTASNVHNAITGEASNYVYLSSEGTYYSVPLQESVKVGEDLEIPINHMICHKSGTIMVSGQLQFFGVTDNDILNARIVVGTDVVAQESTRSRGNRTSIYLTPRLYNVTVPTGSTGVLIDIQAVNSSNTGGYVANSNSTSPQVTDIDRYKNYLTVQYV